MFGFFFGTLCLLGLGGVMRRMAWMHHGRFAYGGGYGGGWGHGPWHGGRGWHGRPGGRGHGPGAAFTHEGVGKAMAEVVKRRLRIDEDQEGIVDHAFADVRKSVSELRDELAATRAGIADAFRGETVDDAALAAAFARHDDALSRARRDLVSSFKQVHAVLDADQRAKAADWMGSAEKGGWI